MNKIEYEIKLNENGRPYINLPEEYDNNSEDKFFALEITIYLLQQIASNRKNEINEDMSNKLNFCIDFLMEVSDNAAHLIKKQLELLAETSLLFDRKYHLMVDNIEERNNFVETIHNGKVFKRKEGLKVLVTDDMTIYELVDGIENVKWKEL